jgi:protein ImuB
MDRLACIDLPAFPLQLLLRENPQWKDHPVVVVAEDKPQAPIVCVNEKARKSTILPGQRYAAALSISKELRAGTVPVHTIDTAVSRLTEALQHYSPEVEPAEDEPGVFWLNAGGLKRMYSSLDTWTKAVHYELSKLGFSSNIVLGFTRFGTYALAKSTQGIIKLVSNDDETKAAYRVRLDRLHMEPSVRETLEKLGVRTVEELLRLPEGGLLKRFGPVAHRLVRLAKGDLWTPLQPQLIREPIEQVFYFDSPESDSERLLFLIKRLLDGLLRVLDSKGESLQSLRLYSILDNGGRRTESIRPAAPTLDVALILGLVRLKLDSIELGAGVVELKLTVTGIKVEQNQTSLLAEKPRRDPEAASRAFARLRAELGEGAVMRAELTDGHLPRSRFRWVPLEKAVTPKPTAPTAQRILVRRLYAKPITLPPRPRQEPEGWLLRGHIHRPIQEYVGPYIVSGGWWGGKTHREYYFIKMKQGEIYWAFFDRHRRRWFLEGHLD